MSATARSDIARTGWPQIRTVGVDGLLVSFGDRLNEPANRAALAFRAALEGAGWAGVQETATSLVSTYLRFDLTWKSHDAVTADLQALLSTQDWFKAPLPAGRKLWRVPTVYGTDLAPQLDEAASAAGLTAEQAIAEISTARVRVQTIGFSPGMPYLGELPEHWNIPRQTQLTDKVPAGALTVAIRQLVLFSVTTPTGWRHIGQTALRLFRPESDTPFVLRPGDEVLFEPTSPETLSNMSGDPDGGAVSEALI
ncbi:MAG: allophanate hydrolase subunit 1 [Alphaproteobacteria bacterium]|nr:allophanate hydrolase subunit 1 [Alphaproteobacteria bacterium]NNF72983.1 carboxyltransferase domain-containing protein [Paracoccaceae bacterium]